MKITLCGSARFEANFKFWNETLSLQGHIIYSLSVYPSDKKDKNWYTKEQKFILDKVHKDKISNSDCIVVINGKERYIGESTTNEINFAFHQRKHIWFEFWPLDETIHNWYPYGNDVFNKDSLFHALCKYSYCPNFLGKPPCLTCYQ